MLSNYYLTLVTYVVSNISTLKPVLLNLKFPSNISVICENLTLENFVYIATGKGKVGKQTFLEGIITSIATLGAGQSAFDIHFEWDSDMGIPGAFYIENFMQVEFFLVSLTLEDVPNQGTIHFICNSWIYNDKKYKSDRIFFANKVNPSSSKLVKLFNLDSFQSWHHPSMRKLIC